MHRPAGTTPNPTLGSLPYATFLDPSLWNEWRGVDFTGHVSYTAALATSALVESVSMGRREPMVPPPVTPLAPTLTPVQAPTLTPAGGTALGMFATLTAVGLVPTISWTAPATGLPTSYLIEIYGLDNVAGASVSTPVATWITGGTSVSLPPGVLAATRTYYARITARIVPSDPFATSPFRRVNTWTWASTLTGTFAP